MLHVRDTAREDVGPFRSAAVAHLRQYLRRDDPPSSLRLLDLRREFPTACHRFLHPPAGGGANVLEFELSHRPFRATDAGKTLRVNRVWVLARCAEEAPYGGERAAVPPAPAEAPDPATRGPFVPNPGRGSDADRPAPAPPSASPPHGPDR